MARRRSLRLILAAAPGDREAREQLIAALIASAAKAMAEDLVEPALACYRELTVLDPGNADFRNNYGILLARTGDVSGAIEQFEAALRADPSHAAARRNLDRLRGKQPPA
jgi:Tfp pilus assembly protein PilF